MLTSVHTVVSGEGSSVGLEVAKQLTYEEQKALRKAREDWWLSHIALFCLLTSFFAFNLLILASSWAHGSGTTVQWFSGTYMLLFGFVGCVSGGFWLDR